MKISDWLHRARVTLADSGCPDPEVDARWMAEEALGMTRTDLLFEGDRAVTPRQLDALERMLARRAAGVPVQYILGTADFMGLRFHVEPGVLIPRQDTETLVESALIELKERHDLESPAVLDLCTGSGCVGLSLKSLAPHIQVTLTDISREALEIARRNARDLELDARFCHGDLYAAIRLAKYDLIVSNPPYIPRGELANLQREVRHEPALALDGGTDGLDFYRRIAHGLQRHLRPGGSVCLEVGVGEAEAVRRMLAPVCAVTGVQKDLNGIERVVWGRMRA